MVQNSSVVKANPAYYSLPIEVDHLHVQHSLLVEVINLTVQSESLFTELSNSIF